MQQNRLCYGVQEPQVSPGASSLEKRLRRLVWEFQEVKQEWVAEGEFRGISDPELCFRSRMSWTQFKETRDRLLEDPDSGLIRTPSGGLAIEW